MFNNKPHTAPLGNVPKFTPPKQRVTRNSIHDGERTNPSIMCSPLGGLKYVISITDDFDKPSVYDEVINVLSIATEQDEIWWNIASYGGFVSSLNMLLGWKQLCPAKQVHVLMSNADSCASAFFLSEADQYIVGDYATMFIHEFQVGSGGTMSNSKRQTDHTYQQNDSFVRNTYAGFLSESEVEGEVLKGLEVHLNAEQIRERLTKREELKAQKAAQDIQDAIDTPLDLSEFSLEEIEEEIELTLKDLKDLKAEVAKRKKGVKEKSVKGNSVKEKTDANDVNSST